MERRDSAVVFVVPGDLHLTEPGLENHRVAQWVVDEVNTLIRPDFVQFIGDNVQDGTAEQYRLFGELAARLQVPWYALVGDHDAQGDPSATRFRSAVGEPCGALGLRGFRFVRLNTQEGRPLGLSPGQAAWFAAEVDAARQAGERVVVFQHNYPYKVWETFDGPGIDAWRAVVQTRRVEAVFTGHTHYGQTANDGRNVAITTRAIGDPEGGPPGYTLAFLHGEDLAITYRTREDAGPVALITHPRAKLLATGPGHVVRGPDMVWVRTWSREPVASARGRIDEGDWFDLRPLGAGVWAHPLAGDGLPKGEHALEAQAVDAQARRGGQRIEFMVDPTGRYTAVPAVRPVVTGTAFC